MFVVYTIEVVQDIRNFHNICIKEEVIKLLISLLDERFSLTNEEKEHRKIIIGTDLSKAAKTG